MSARCMLGLTVAQVVCKDECMTTTTEGMDTMTTTVTIKFRAKLSEFQRVDGFRVSDARGYKVPALMHSHVTFSERDTVAQLITQGLGRRDPRPALKNRFGLDIPAYVDADNPGDWTITPVGNGYMSDVSISATRTR